MSLRDELLKAGLASADKAKKVHADARKQDYQRKKSKIADEDAARQAEIRRQAEADALRKREHDRQLNLEREAEKHRRERAARAHQLIDSHRLNNPDAEILYNFLDSDGHWIRAIRVLAPQRQGLAMGQLAIVRGDRHEHDFPLVPRDIALKLSELAPERVLLLHPESDGSEAEESLLDSQAV
ncbi:MAG: uncharacterized protein QG599_1405 [Pseudomonadota bacterium]|nr:uncharacterized protein [Pseudomonadota bacterium]